MDLACRFELNGHIFVLRKYHYWRLSKQKKTKNARARHHGVNSELMFYTNVAMSIFVFEYTTEFERAAAVYRTPSRNFYDIKDIGKSFD